MPTHGPRILAVLLWTLLGLACLALFLPANHLQAQDPPADPTLARPYDELYLPLVMRVVNPKPFPTDPPTITPTATNTRRPTITQSPTPTLTSSSTPSSTTTPTATLLPGVTPSMTTSPTVSRTPTITQTPSPTVSPTPVGRVNVLSSRAYAVDTSAVKQVVVVGEVRNDSPQTVENVVITVSLLRDDLLPITSAIAEVFTVRIGPGQRAPFRLMTDRPTEYDSASVAVTGWSWATATPLPTLTPPTHTFRASGVENALAGRVANSSASAITQVRVVAIFRDPQGAVANVVDSGMGAASPYGLILNPGQTTPFRILLPATPTPGTPEYLILYASATAAAPAALPTSGLRADRLSDHIDLFGEVQNTTSGPIREVQIIATFFNASDQVVNAAWVWASQNADRILNPDARSPFQVTLDGPNANTWRRYELQTFHRAAPAPLPTPIAFETPTFQVTLDYQHLDLRGRVVNNTTATVHRPRLVVTFIKGDQVQYTLSETLAVAENLAPGAGVAYNIRHNLPRDVGPTLTNVTVTYALDFQP